MFLKCHVLQFWRLWFWFFGQFSAFKKCKICKKSKFSAWKCIKMADFALLESLKSISRKIWLMEKIWSFQTVVSINVLQKLFYLFFTNRQSTFLVAFSFFYMALYCKNTTFKSFSSFFQTCFVSSSLVFANGSWVEMKKDILGSATLPKV